MGSVLNISIALLFGLIWLIVILFLRLKRKKGFVYLLILSVFSLYLFKVLDYTLFQFQSLLILKQFIPGLMLNGVEAGKNFNLVPLINLTPGDIKTSLLNILLMIPFGFGLPLIAKLRMKKVVVAGLLFSISIELMQLLTGIIGGITFRIADINDVIFNTAGAAIGYILYRAMSMNPMKEKRRVLIADIINSDGVAEIPFLFKRADCHVAVFCPPKSWLLKNGYWDTHIVPESLTLETYVRHLEREVMSGAYDWVVLADDMAGVIVNIYASPEAVLKMLPISDLRNRRMVGSKAGLHALCSECGILIPRGTVCQTHADVEKALPDIRFPVLLKIDHGGGGQGVFICKDKEEVIRAYEKLSLHQKKDALLQEYVQGDIVSVEGIFYRGNVIAHASSTVLCNVGGETSISMVREYGGHEKLGGIMKNIGTALSLNGFCSFTFMHDKEKDLYYLVEADPRPHSWFRAAHLAGVDFSKAISAYFSAREGVAVSLIPQIPKKIIVRNFGRNMYHALQFADFKELASWCLNRGGRWKCIPFYDPIFLLNTLWSVGKLWVFLKKEDWKKASKVIR